MGLSTATERYLFLKLPGQHFTFLCFQPALQFGFAFQLMGNISCYLGVHFFLFIYHLMVQCSLSFGILFFPDLLRQGSWKVLTNDLVPMFVAFVVLRDFFILQLVS